MFQESTLEKQISAIVGDETKTQTILALIRREREKEKAVFYQKQAQGIAQARANGVVFGRKKLVRPENYNSIKVMYQKKELSARQAAKELGIGHSTFLRWLREEELSK